MTPAKKIHLAFQMYDMARRILWTTERQAHPDASPQELGWRVLRRMHGKELCFNLSPDELADLFAYVVSILERLSIPYMVVGGFAAITYGEPRLTLDVDIMDMQHRHVDSFVVAFPIPEYYISRDGIVDSLTRRYPFNVIKPDSGAKVDLVPLPLDP